MSVVDKLRGLGLPEDTLVSLRYEDGCDVVHVRDDYVEATVADTGIASTLASLVVDSGYTVQTEYGDNFLDVMRSDDLLEDYDRGEFAFTEFVADRLAETFYDNALIEYETNQYDYKRGYCTVSANVQVPLSEVLNHPLGDLPLGGWTASVQTENGNLTLS